MKHFLLAVGCLVSLGALVPTVAEAGCRCGKSYIADWKTCHKCPCECPSCDYRDCAAPEARYTPVRMTLAAKPVTGSTANWVSR
jgi:hypothetical protein